MSPHSVTTFCVPSKNSLKGQQDSRLHFEFQHVVLEDMQRTHKLAYSMLRVLLLPVALWAGLVVLHGVTVMVNSFQLDI